jgi:hypothetical protein
MAAVVCGLAMPQTGFAENIQSFWQKYFVMGSEDTTDFTQENVYEDDGEHVTMQVQELFTDGCSFYATIKYSALDQTGEEWLAGMSFDDDHLRILPPYGNGSAGTEVLSSNETEIYLAVLLDMETQQNETGEVALSYPMEGETKAKQVNLSFDSDVEVYTYKLESEQAPGEDYVPEYFQISPLSYTIYGKNLGIYENTLDGQRSLDSDEEDTLEAYLVKKDGTRINTEDLGGSRFTGASTLVNGQMTDLVIQHAVFWQDNNFRSGIRTTIDPEEMIGLEICGVYYELKK